jgi:hypothetical protein
MFDEIIIFCKGKFEVNVEEGGVDVDEGAGAEAGAGGHLLV